MQIYNKNKHTQTTATCFTAPGNSDCSFGQKRRLIKNAHLTHRRLTAAASRPIVLCRATIFATKHIHIHIEIYFLDAHTPPSVSNTSLVNLSLGGLLLLSYIAYIHSESAAFTLKSKLSLALESKNLLPRSWKSSFDHDLYMSGLPFRDHYTHAFRLQDSSRVLSCLLWKNANLDKTSITNYYCSQPWFAPASAIIVMILNSRSV